MVCCDAQYGVRKFCDCTADPAKLLWLSQCDTQLPKYDLFNDNTLKQVMMLPPFASLSLSDLKPNPNPKASHYNSGDGDRE